MKHAARETRHYRAMASAWELKEAEHYAKLVGFVHARDRKVYEESSNEGRDDAEDFMAYSHEVYNEELISFDTANIQLDQLEDEVRVRLETNITAQFPYNHPSDEPSMGCGDDEHTGLNEEDDTDVNNSEE